MAYTSVKSTTDIAAGERQQQDWNPYDSNGGTCLAVAGADYCIVAATTRLSTGFTILCRSAPGITQLSDQCIVVSTGFQADIKTVHKTIQAKNIMYQHQHRRPMSCPAVARCLSNTLYHRRFFPYYTSTICAGLDPSDKGVVYSYDVIGSMSLSNQCCKGTGESLMQPLLDNQLGASNVLLHPPREQAVLLSLDDAVDLIKDAFVAAGERDIYTGDQVEIYIMTSEGVKKEVLDLKRD